MTPLKIVFAGTPAFSASNLQALLNSEHEVIGVYTQPDRPAGRGKKLTASPVKQLAQQHNIPVFQPVNLKNVEAQQQLAQLNADVMVVVAYGLLLPQAVLDAPNYGCLNVHASLLPRWRGAAPIQRAIEAGDSESGVTIMQMDIGLDTGDMLHKVITPITSHDTGGSLHDRLATLGSEAIVTVLNDLTHFQSNAQKQDDSNSNYADKLNKQQAQIDWQQPAAELERRIRAFNPWPICFTSVDNQPLKIWQAQIVDESSTYAAGTIVSADKQGLVIATGEQLLRITQLQPAGKKPMSVADLLNAKKAQFQVGTRLGD